MKVSLCEMFLNDEMKQAALNVLESGKYINGIQSKKFESEFANFVGAKYGISVNSGTSALFIAFMDIKLSPGDEVIVPSHTFIASASQAIHLGAKPVFVDCDTNNFTMNIDDVKKKITNRTRAIVAVHIYGHPVNMHELKKVIEGTEIKIIEDCAQSHGSLYKGKMTGSFGDYSCFSFFPSKIMNVGGDGGMILTNDENSAKNMRMLKNHGRIEKYKHEIIAMNMRMPEIPAAIGRIQLKHIQEFIERRKRIVNKYNKAFKSIKYIKTPQFEEWADPVLYTYVIQIENRNDLISYLKKKNIETGIHYPIPLHQQPIIEKHYGKQVLLNTEYICKRILSLPLSSAMTDEQVEYVIQNIINYYEQKIS